MDDLTPIGPTGLSPSKEEYFNHYLKHFKPKHMVTIHINGLKFIVDKRIKASELCARVNAPIDNSEIFLEDGRQIKIGDELNLFGGEHFQITRLQVTGN